MALNRTRATHLGDAGGDDADADLGDEFDGDACRRIGALEIVDEFGQVLDRVDVVVRRRRDQADAGHRVARPRDLLRHFVAGTVAEHRTRLFFFNQIKIGSLKLRSPVSKGHYGNNTFHGVSPSSIKDCMDLVFH